MARELWRITYSYVQPIEPISLISFMNSIQNGTSSRLSRSALFLWLAAAILLGGFVARLVGYDYHGLEGDDAFSLSLSRLPLDQLVPGLMAFELDIHPPLHFLLVKAWTGTAGESLLSLRLLNYLMDMLTGGLLIRLAGRSLNRRAALLAGLFWIGAPLLLNSDLLVRMYTLLALEAAVGFVCVVEARRARGWRRPALFLALGGCALVAMYTHMLGFVLAGVFAAGILAGAVQPTDTASRRSAIFALIPLAVAGVLSLPYAQALWALYRSGRPLGAEINSLAAFAFADVPDVIVSTLLTGRPLVVFPFLLTLMLMVGIVLVCRRWRARVLPLAVMGAAGIAAMIGLAWAADLFKPRYLTPFVVPLLALLAGAALLPKRALWRGMIAVSIVGLSGAGLVADFDRTLRDDWVAAARYIETHEQPGDVALVLPDWGGEAFRYHYHGTSPVTSLLPGVSADLDLGGLLTPLVERRSRVWLVLYQPLVTDPAGLVDSWFRARAVTLTEVFPSGIQVRLYDLNPLLAALPENARPLDAEFGGRLALRGVTLPLTQGTSRDSRLHPPSTWVYVELYWQSVQPGADAFPRVRLTDGIGQVYGETLARDSGLLTRYPAVSWGEGQIIRAGYDLNLNPSTPAGLYNIEVMVLDPATGAPLPAAGADAGAQWAIAGQFTVK